MEVQQSPPASMQQASFHRGSVECLLAFWEVSTWNWIKKKIIIMKLANKAYDILEIITEDEANLI